MPGIKKDTWQKDIMIALKSTIVTAYDVITGNPNFIQIRNYGTDPVYFSLSPIVSPLSFLISVAGGGTRNFTDLYPFKKLYFYCVSNASIVISMAEVDEIYPTDIDQTQTSIIISNETTGNVQVTAPLPEGNNKIGGVVLKDIANNPIGVEGNPLEVNATVSVGAVTVDMGGSPSIYNIQMVLADTQYSVNIPQNAKKIMLSVMDGEDTFHYRLSYESGKVAAPTAPYKKYSGNVEYDPGLIKVTADDLVLYFACSVPGKTMQVEIWV